MPLCCRLLRLLAEKPHGKGPQVAKFCVTMRDDGYSLLLVVRAFEGKEKLELVVQDDFLNSIQLRPKKNEPAFLSNANSNIPAGDSQGAIICGSALKRGVRAWMWMS